MVDFVTKTCIAWASRPAIRSDRWQIRPEKSRDATRPAPRFAHSQCANYMRRQAERPAVLGDIGRWRYRIRSTSRAPFNSPGRSEFKPLFQCRRKSPIRPLISKRESGGYACISGSRPLRSPPGPSSRNDLFATGDSDRHIRCCRSTRPRMPIRRQPDSAVLRRLQLLPVGRSVFDAGIPERMPDAVARFVGEDSDRIPVGAKRACCSVMYTADKARSSGVGSWTATEGAIDTGAGRGAGARRTTIRSDGRSESDRRNWVGSSVAPGALARLPGVAGLNACWISSGRAGSTFLYGLPFAATACCC